MDKSHEQALKQGLDLLTGNPLASSVFLGVSLGVIALSCAFYALYDVLIARLWTWAVLSALSLVFKSPDYGISTLIHHYTFFRRPYLFNLLRNISLLIARDGNDEELTINVMTSFFQILVHGFNFLIFANFSAFYHYISSWLLWASPIAGVFVALWILLIYGFGMSVFAPVMILFQALPHLQALHLRVAPTIGQTVIASYAWTGKTFRKFYAYRTQLLGENRPKDWGQPYVYSPLIEDRCIRLLQIGRRGPFGDCTCEIVHARLDETLTFEAISYTWGEPILDQKLLVNNKAIPVTSRVIEIIESRASFLDRKLIWIDSVCINQKDLLEKSSQILLMKDIYRIATRVLVWLGTAPDAFHAMGYMAHVNRKLQWSAAEEGMREKLVGPQSDDPRAPALFEFWNHPWWSRAWIIQEVAMAEKVIVSYGNEYVSWLYLEQFCSNVSKLIPASRASVMGKDDNMGIIPAVGFGHMKLLTQIRERCRTADATLKFIEIVEMTRGFCSTDPRDKVYAISGLSNAAKEPLLVPDYTKSVVEIFSNAARYLCSENILDTLASAGIGHTRQTSGLPSWAPDFACLKHSNFLQFRSDAISSIVGSAYRASGDSDLSCELHYSAPILRTSCLLFDSIAVTGPPCIVYTGGAKSTMDLAKVSINGFLAVVSFAQDNIGHSNYSFTDQPNKEVVWRTLIGDRGMADASLQRPAPDDYGQKFEVLNREMIEDREQIRELEDPNHSDDSLEKFRNRKQDFRIQRAFAEVTNMAGMDKRLAITKRGAICLVPIASEVGDEVGVMGGAQSCTVLRRQKMSEPVSSGVLLHTNMNSQTQYEWPEPEWRFVGNCYVHGFMDGEALSAGQQWKDVYIW